MALFPPQASRDAGEGRNILFFTGIFNFFRRRSKNEPLTHSARTKRARTDAPFFRHAGQMFSVNLRVLRNQRKTEEGDPQDDDSYLGYSVATGEFNGDGDRMDVAVGMPRGANLTGKVGVGQGCQVLVTEKCQTLF